MAISTEEFLARYRHEDGVNVGNCVICEKPIITPHCAQTDLDEVQRYDGGLAHADCYFERLGELVEKHPITSPKSGHGHCVG